MTSASVNSLQREGSFTWVLQEAGGTEAFKTPGPFGPVSANRYGKANQPTDNRDTFQSAFVFTHEVRHNGSMWLSHVDKSGSNRPFYCDIIEIIESIQISDGWGAYTPQTTIQGSYYCCAKLALPLVDKTDIYALVKYDGKYDYQQAGPVASVIVKVIDEGTAKELGAFQVSPPAGVFASILTEDYDIPVGTTIRLEMWTSLSYTTTRRGSFDVAGQRMLMALASGEKPRTSDSSLINWSKPESNRQA